jgi:hypothetical protein
MRTFGFQTGKQAFVTASDDPRKVASAIWAHLTPVLQMAWNMGIRRVHFISDSPSGQYRNKFNAYLLYNYLLKNLGFESGIWNFCESGHGKGAPDGVGAAAKRAADKRVSNGFNVLNANDFVSVVSVNNMLAWVVSNMQPFSIRFFSQFVTY